jgi:DNA-directed RNA polymerase subunit N (RpoN/RPB10)
VQERRGKNHIGDIVIIPVRCFTCGKVISDLYEDFVKRYDDYKKAMDAGEKPKETPKQILDDLGLERYCCRRMLLTHVDLIGEAAPYE